jgi:hypothetical protein
MDAQRWRGRAPWAAAVLAVVTVLLVVLPVRAGQEPAPDLPDPDPIGPVPVALDRLEQSLDRCAAALDAAGLAGQYPERSGWRPVATLFSDTTAVALLEAEVPFVCAAGPSAVEVSDPRAAVPVDRALLLVSTASGVVAAVAPAGARVQVTAAGERPSGVVAHRAFLRLVPQPITDAGQLTVTVGDEDGVRSAGAPQRLAPPALRVVDRQVVPADGSSGAVDLLRRCLLAAGAAGAVGPGGWTPAQVLVHRLDGQPASLLVAVDGSGVGGCSVAPGVVTPLRSWGPGSADGDRPFVWLNPLPDVAADLVAGPVRSEVVRMEVRSGDGRGWRVVVAGGTFAAQAPPGEPVDPRALVVSAYAADDTLLYEGPAVG